MEIALTVLAAMAASGFAVDLARSYRSRPRAHAAVWAIAMAMYALATWSLAVGLAAGWTVATFKSFYYFGAIANIPLLAAGSVYLNASTRVARWFTIAVAVFLVLGAVVVLAAPVDGLVPRDEIPEGSDLFSYGLAAGSVSVPGPRLFAAVAGGLGTLTIVVLAAVAVVRTWAKARRLAVGNLLIVLGVLVLASAGSLTALGEAGGLALSLLVGAVLLWSGYRVASAHRPPGLTQ